LIQRIYGQKPSETEDYRSHSTTKGDVLQLQPPHIATATTSSSTFDHDDDDYLIAETIEDEPLNLEEQEVELIKRALERNKGKRKAAADELGISERTLYRKIKQYNL
jgi:transcriptional regulator with PAS, ATPase and Fis domain